MTARCSVCGQEFWRSEGGPVLCLCTTYQRANLGTVAPIRIPKPDFRDETTRAGDVDTSLVG